MAYNPFQMGGVGSLLGGFGGGQQSTNQGASSLFGGGGGGGGGGFQPMGFYQMMQSGQPMSGMSLLNGGQKQNPYQLPKSLDEIPEDQRASYTKLLQELLAAPSPTSLPTPKVG